MPAWNSVAPDGALSVQALAAWMQALGTPLLVGLATLALLLAALGYVAVHILWLAPAVQRGRRWQRCRAAGGTPPPAAH